MPKTYQFSEEQVAELTVAKKKNKNKTVDHRIEVLLLGAAKVKRMLVSEKTGFCKQYITALTASYQKNGLSAITENHYCGNRHNMSLADEKAFLEPCIEQSERGQLIEISAIKAACEEKVGHTIGGSQMPNI